MPAGFWPFLWLSLYRSQLRWPTWIRVLNAFLCQSSCKTVTLINSCGTGDCTGHGSYLEHLLLNISQLKKKKKTNFLASKHFYTSSKSKMKVENNCFDYMCFGCTGRKEKVVDTCRLQRKIASLSPTLESSRERKAHYAQSLKHGCVASGKEKRSKFRKLQTHLWVSLVVRCLNIRPEEGLMGWSLITPFIATVFQYMKLPKYTYFSDSCID